MHRISAGLCFMARAPVSIAVPKRLRRPWKPDFHGANPATRCVTEEVDLACSSISPMRHSAVPTEGSALSSHANQVRAKSLIDGHKLVHQPRSKRRNESTYYGSVRKRRGFNWTKIRSRGLLQRLGLASTRTNTPLQTCTRLAKGPSTSLRAGNVFSTVSNCRWI